MTRKCFVNKQFIHNHLLKTNQVYNFFFLHFAELLPRWLQVQLCMEIVQQSHWGEFQMCFVAFGILCCSFSLKHSPHRLNKKQNAIKQWKEADWYSYIHAWVIETINMIATQLDYFKTIYIHLETSWVQQISRMLQPSSQQDSPSPAK